MTTCWSCGAEVAEAVACGACGKLQPVGDQTFFEVLGLPAQMRQERGIVDRSFREASKHVHPDRLGPGAPALERRIAVERTAHLNEAYRALKSDQSRAEYLLSLEGVVVGDEMARTKDPAFLMEMMEHQEAVDTAKSVDVLEEQRSEVVTRRRALMDSLTRYFDDREGRQEDAAKALDELRYLRRLIERIDVKLEEMI